MGNCLITKLKESVDNNNLVKLGELKIAYKESKTTSVRQLMINSEEAQTITIDGNCYFTNTKGDNLGKSATISPNSSTQYISNGECTVLVENKYSLTKLKLVSNSNAERNITNISNVEDLAYCNKMVDIGLAFCQESLGNVENAFGKMNELIVLDLNGNTSVYGDIGKAIKDKTKLNYFSIANNSNLSANTEDFADLSTLTYLYVYNVDNFKGDVQNFKVLTNLETLSMSKSKNINGDIALLAPYIKKIKTLTVQDGNISCTDISAFAQCSNLTYISATNAKGTFGGDLAKMPANLKSVILTGVSNTMSWTNRPSTSSIFGMTNVNLGDDLDKMLINMAQCDISALSGANATSHTIRVSGTQTSASDSAIATLKEKGMTVIINGVTK